jgi:glutathione S-transferase
MVLLAAPAARYETAMTLTLVIGNKAYSSWSLRPWLLLKVKSLAFDEVRVPLYQQHSKAAIHEHVPAGQAQYGKVPILRDGDLTVWDSLSICEYIAEHHRDAGCWPDDSRDRARARSISAEMHAGFRELRTRMPMNCRRAPEPVPRDAALDADIARVIEIWTQARGERVAAGPFLFGDFGIADAMYAPVVLRFTGYAVDLPPPARAYADAVLALPALRAWIADGQRETEVLTQFQK